MHKTQKKTALVTGSSRGIGAVIAQRLAADGFNVVVNYSGSDDAVESVVAGIERNGGAAICVKADVSDPAAVARMYDNIEKHFGGVDVLVNNAGIMKLAKIIDSSDDLFDAQIAVNLKGTFNLMRQGGRRVRDGGRIINISTSVVALKLETYGVYAATKAAVETITAIMAKELRGRSITVNAVAPGPTATDLFLSGKSEEVIERMSNIPPLERLGTPEDIARVVAFLVSADSEWVNGQVIRANGGMI